MLSLDHELSNMLLKELIRRNHDGARGCHFGGARQHPLQQPRGSLVAPYARKNLCDCHRVLKINHLNGDCIAIHKNKMRKRTEMKNKESEVLLRNE